MTRSDSDERLADRARIPGNSDSLLDGAPVIIWQRLCKLNLPSILTVTCHSCTPHMCQPWPPPPMLESNHAAAPDKPQLGKI